LGHFKFPSSVFAGDISLKIPPSLESKLDLKADSVSVDDRLDMSFLRSTKSDKQEQVSGIIENTCFFA